MRAGQTDCKYRLASPDPNEECRRCRRMDPPRTRFWSPMEATLVRLNNILNAKELGVTVSYSDVRDDIVALGIMSGARDNARDERREEERRDREFKERLKSRA